MYINITFVIQGINFGICYLVLKYFFLKPAILLLNAREAEYNKMLGDLEKDENALQKKIVYKEMLIENFRSQVNAQYPVFEGPSEVLVPYPVTYRENDATTAVYQETLKELLVAKASHAR